MQGEFLLIYSAEPSVISTLLGIINPIPQILKLFLVAVSVVLVKVIT